MHDRARERLDRLRRFLPDLGSPQADLPVIHVTGTSGKGSTAAAIAALLAGAGLRVGLATSPYLQVATEKLQLGGRLISGIDLLTAAEAIDRAEAGWRRRTGERRLTYGEAWTALTLVWLANSAVDLAVVEVGAGGRLDTTNVVEPVASVITNIGRDHIESLGPSLADVAWHKAGIIKPGAVALTGEPSADLLPILRDESSSAGVELIVVPPNASGWADAVPTHVRQNRALALATFQALAERGLVDADRLDPSLLASARLPGRLEWMPPGAGPDVLLDGAHNADKAAALRSAVEGIRQTRGQLPPVVVAGTLAAKDTASLAPLLTLGSALIATTAATTGKSASPPAALAAIARANGFTGPVTIEADPRIALTRALDMAAVIDTWVVGTGSLYLVGALRRAWFPDRAIVEARSPWPNTDAQPMDTGR